jgi:hypothetical protein
MQRERERDAEMQRETEKETETETERESETDRQKARARTTWCRVQGIGYRFRGVYSVVLSRIQGLATPLTLYGLLLAFRVSGVGFLV